jgi:O-antigen/teichoic acid export membrane protein
VLRMRSPLSVYFTLLMKRSDLTNIMSNGEPQFRAEVLSSSSIAPPPTEAMEDVALLAGHPRISHAFLLTASQLVRRLLRFAFGLIVARSLGAENFGVYAVLFAVTEMLSWASGTGFSEYLARETAKDPAEGWQIAPQMALLRLIYTVPLVLAGVGILSLLRYPRWVLVACAFFCLTLVPRAVSEVVQGVLRGQMLYAGFCSIEIAQGMPLLLGGGFLLVNGGGLKVAIATEVIASAIACVVALVVAIRLRARRGKWGEWSTLVKRTLPFNIYPLASILYDKVDAVMISKLAGDYATGIYGVAYAGLGALQLLPYGILVSILPALSRGTWGAPQKQRLENAMGLLLNVGLLAVLGAMFFSGSVVHWLLGPGYTDSAVAIQILMWAIIPRYINFALGIGLLAMRRERVFIVTSSICLVVNVVSNLVLIPRFSWRAAAYVTIFTELVLLAQNVWWIRRTVGTIPVPLRAARSSAVFIALLLMTLLGKNLVSPIVMGSVSIGMFLAYVYRSGMILEFKAAWQATPDITG